MDISRLKAGLYGALVGDAYGVPYEFKNSADIPVVISGAPPDEYPRSHPGVPFGCWSDDGSQLLCLLDVLTAGKGKFSSDLFVRQLVLWFTEGRHQSGGRVFDCGLGTAAVLRRLAEGVPVSALASQGGLDQRAIGSEGNGSVMRTLPATLAVLRYANNSRLPADLVVDIALAQSSVTHASSVPRAACAAYALTSLRLFSEPDTPARDAAFAAIKTLREAPPPGLSDALLHLERFGKQELPTGGGHASNAFWSGITAVDGARSYRDAIEHAIGLGNDTDTTACIAGGLAGLVWGIGGAKGVPESWISTLVVPAESQQVIDQFLQVSND